MSASLLKRLATPALFTLTIGAMACGPHMAPAGSGGVRCQPPAHPPVTGNNFIPAQFQLDVSARGETACIVGNGFGSQPGQVLFYFGDHAQPTSGQIQAWANTLIEVIVPAGALTGPVEATTSTGEPFYAGRIFILAPPNGVTRLTAAKVTPALSGQPTMVSFLAQNSKGKPVTGAKVDLSDGLGTISCHTDNAGKCSLALSAFQSANLVAISGTAWVRVYVPVTQPPDERMTLTTSAAVLVDGESATLTAVVTDPQGNPIPNQEVDFSTGSASTAVINPARAFTDPTGTASTTITSPSPDDAIVEADTNDSSTNAAVEVSWSTSIVTSISPTSGPLSGGTVVTIRGAGFTSSAVVYFGKNTSRSVTFVDSKTLRAVAPAGSGTVGVQVQVAGSYSDLLTAPQFAYS